MRPTQRFDPTFPHVPAAIGAIGARSSFRRPSTRCPPGCQAFAPPLYSGRRSLAMAPESICPDAAIGGTMSAVSVFRAGRRFRVGEEWGCRPLQRPKALKQPCGRLDVSSSRLGRDGVGVQGAPMSKAAGVVLILGGLGLAAFAMSSEFAVRGSDAARRVEEAKITRAEAKVVEPMAVPRPDPVLRTAAAPRPEAVPSGSAPVIVTLAPRSGD